MESLKAELTKNPSLSMLVPEDGDQNPPAILFSNRRQGYFKAKHLCRLWTLQTFRWLRMRGEYFVVWADPRDTSGGQYDGRLVLAHAFTIKYLSLHQPGMSVVFDDKGALKTTSNIQKNIRR